MTIFCSGVASDVLKERGGICFGPAILRESWAARHPAASRDKYSGTVMESSQLFRGST